MVQYTDEQKRAVEAANEITAQQIADLVTKFSKDMATTFSDGYISSIRALDDEQANKLRHTLHLPIIDGDPTTPFEAMAGLFESAAAEGTTVVLQEIRKMFLMGGIAHLLEDQTDEDGD